MRLLPLSQPFWTTFVQALCYFLFAFLMANKKADFCKMFETVKCISSGKQIKWHVAVTKVVQNGRGGLVGVDSFLRSQEQFWKFLIFSPENFWKIIEICAHHWPIEFMFPPCCKHQKIPIFSNIWDVKHWTWISLVCWELVRKQMVMPWILGHVLYAILVWKFCGTRWVSV